MSKLGFFFLSLAFSVRLLSAQDVIRCAHGDLNVTQDQLKKINEEELKLKEVSRASLRLEEEAVYTVPVVVHIVYYDNTQYFTYAQVLDQIRVLNEDFRKKNADIINTPIGFMPDVADAHIEFALAKRDPNGSPTNGVTYTKTTKTSFNYSTEEVKHANLGGHDAWDPKSYLNIWVCNLSSGASKVIGYVPYPLYVGSSEDGVAVSYTAFGTSGNLNPKYTLGRTATHEIGHWLNLLHLWGDPMSFGCTTDFIDDTPPQADGTNSNLNCPGYPYLPSNDTCNKNDRNKGRMWCNFLDYTRDQCMSMFSNGQVSRMRAYLTTFRPGILNSKALLQNDLALTNVIYDPTKNCGEQTSSPVIGVENRGLDTVSAFDLYVTVNGGSQTKINWQGVLGAGKDTVLRLTSYTLQEGLNQIKAKVVLTVPQPDQDTSNNSTTYSFTCPVQHDLKVVSLTLDPQQNCEEGPNDVKVKIQNAGSEQVKIYKLSYFVNDTLKFEEQWQGTMQASTDTLWTIKSGPFGWGNNVLKVVVRLLEPGTDQNPSNDSLSTTTECSSPLSIYPNPASSILYTKGNDPQVESVIMYSVDGKEVLRSDYSQSIDISLLKQGLYIVTFVTKENRIRYELIVVR